MTLFTRLALGYLTMFLMVATVGVYAFYQLHQFNELTEAILEIDNRVLDHEKILVDLLFSQSRYEQKFTISQDETLHKEFLRLKEEFNEQWEKASALGDPMAGTLLATLKRDYRAYEGLVLKEVELLRVNRQYAQEEYKQQKSQLLDAMLAALQQLRQEKQNTMVARVQTLARSADQARRVLVIIATLSLLGTLLLSGCITRSVTTPVSLLKAKTREIARGRFESALEIKSPPEIAELAAAFNAMCERLKELDRLKADFFSSVSHELRTPLTSIKEGTGLLLASVGGETTEKQQKLLAIVAEESNRLIGVVNSLLDLSKMEAGMMKYRFESRDLVSLADQAVNEILPLAEVKQITLHRMFEANLPAVKLDPDKMLQVLRNLLGNAVKFTPRGGQITSGATLQNGKLKFYVQDSGPGIPESSRNAIFDKFQQGDHSGAYPNRGTGLGLAIAREIIASHGGEIWVESQLNEGSTFYFVLPC